MRNTTIAIWVIGIATILSVSAFSLAASKAEPRDAALKSQLQSIVLEGWKTSLSASLDSAQGREEEYKTKLATYFSDQPHVRAINSLDNKIQPLGDAPGKPTRQPVEVTGFTFAGPSASELERQINYIDYGRYSERLGQFKVRAYAVDSVEYQSTEVHGDVAKVVADIKWWIDLVHATDGGKEESTRPKGGEEHTFTLQKQNNRWLIVDDSFRILPGFEP
jgi:hypothetical protein